MKICAVIPTHNHANVLGPLAEKLHDLGLPVVIVDDGSDAPFCTTIAALHHPEHNIDVIRFEKNRGKGAACEAGFRFALERGFTHALQIDADGQHDLAALPALFAKAEKHPSALITGQPLYDSSMPLGRRIGRWITHFWVWVETLSFQITDSMCGFRIYPLEETLAVLQTASVGQRLDFDTEIMVRLFWRGTPVGKVPVRVIYPEGNLSNFRLFRDNLIISAMHTKLVISMLLHLPSIIKNRPAPLKETA